MEVCMSNNLTVAEGHEINGLGERLRRYHRIIFKMDIYIFAVASTIGWK